MQYFEKNWVIGLERHRSLKNGCIQCRFTIPWRFRSSFVFDRILSMNHLKVHQWLHKYLLKRRLKNLRLTCARVRQNIQGFKRAIAWFSSKHNKKRSSEFWLWGMLPKIERSYSVKQRKELSSHEVLPSTPHVTHIKFREPELYF